jgi:hypothetical protein
MSRADLIQNLREVLEETAVVPSWSPVK